VCASEPDCRLGGQPHSSEGKGHARVLEGPPQAFTPRSSAEYGLDPPGGPPILRDPPPYSHPDRDTMEFLETSFDSLKRELHQEFEEGGAVGRLPRRAIS
jgi:hypothetical protein